MIEFVDPIIFWGMWALQSMGLISVVLARVPRAGLLQSLGRTCFFGCLMFVAVITMLAIGAKSGCWVWCGTTFSLMAVGATLDVSGPLRATSF